MVAGGVAWVLAAGASRPATVPAGDGGFDGGAGGWKTMRTGPAGCATPVRFVDAGADSDAAAIAGDARGGASPGCDPSWIFLDFECGGDSPGGFCTVSFDASLWLVAGEHAAVILAGDSGSAAFEIPGDRGGQTGQYAVSIAGAGAGDGAGLRLIFAVWNAPAIQRGTRSLLRVDNVRPVFTPDSVTTVTLTPMHPDAIPFAAIKIDGHLLQSVVATADCNANGLPDTYEISQGIAFDRDGDHRPDDCDGRERRIDWVLLTLGAVILVATFVRLVRRNRSRYV